MHGTPDSELQYHRSIPSGYKTTRQYIFKIISSPSYRLENTYKYLATSEYKTTRQF